MHRIARWILPTEARSTTEQLYTIDGRFATLTALPRLGNIDFDRPSSGQRPHG